MSDAGFAVCPRPSSFNEIDQPPSLQDLAPNRSGGKSDQAMASLFQLYSVPFFQSVNMSTAIFRAVATAALLYPRRAARRTAQDFSVENRPISRRTQDAA